MDKIVTRGIAARIPSLRSEILNGFEDGCTKLFSIHAEPCEQVLQCALIVHGLSSPIFGTGSVPLTPTRIVEEALDVLRVTFESEFDQSVPLPVFSGDYPLYRQKECMEVPLPRRSLGGVPSAGTSKLTKNDYLTTRSCSYI